MPLSRFTDTFFEEQIPILLSAEIGAERSIILACKFHRLLPEDRGDMSEKGKGDGLREKEKEKEVGVEVADGADGGGVANGDGVKETTGDGVGDTVEKAVRETNEAIDTAEDIDGETAMQIDQDDPAHVKTTSELVQTGTNHTPPTPDTSSRSNSDATEGSDKEVKKAEEAEVVWVMEMYEALYEKVILRQSIKLVTDYSAEILDVLARACTSHSNLKAKLYFMGRQETGGVEMKMIGSTLAFVVREDIEGKISNFVPNEELSQQSIAKEMSRHKIELERRAEASSTIVEASAKDERALHDQEMINLKARIEALKRKNGERGAKSTAEWASLEQSLNAIVPPEGSQGELTGAIPEEVLVTG